MADTRSHLERRRRVPAEEVRNLMLKAGQETVYSEGIRLDLAHINFETLIMKAGVPRSSAYRLWPYREDYVNELLTHLASPLWLGTATFDSDTVAVAEAAIGELSEQLATPEGRRAVKLEVIRRAVAQNSEALVSTKEWHTWIALNASAAGGADNPTQLRMIAMLAHSEMTFVDKMAEFYSGMLQYLGLRLKPQYSIRHFIVTAASALDGLALRSMIARALKGKDVPDDIPRHGWELSDILDSPLPSPDPEFNDSDDWTLPAISFLAVVEFMTESSD